VYSSLDARDAKRWQKAFDAGDEDAFCKLFGPQEIPPHIAEFLGYFMVRKVSAGQELLKAAGTVTGKLARWLEQHDHIATDAAEIAVDRARDSARELPAADRLTDLLVEVAINAPDIDVDDVGEEDWVEDQLMIDQIAPGRSGLRAGSARSRSPSARASSLNRAGWCTSSPRAVKAGGICSRSAPSTHGQPAPAIFTDPRNARPWSRRPVSHARTGPRGRLGPG